jgi:hypothetical protein
MVINEILADIVTAYRGPADGFFGSAQLRQAATRLYVVVADNSVMPDDDADRVY